MSDLLPCPFCGNESVVVTGVAQTQYVYCNSCKFYGPEENEVVTKWNHRPTPEYTQTYSQFEASLKAERERAERAEKENESVRSIIAMMDYAALRETLDNIRVALGMEKSTSDDYILAQIDKILNNGTVLSKIERIKKYRQLTDSSLADSKIFIEKHYDNNGFGKRL